MRRLEGKVAIIAGAGGIGNGTARRLVSEGCAVMLGDLNGANAVETAAAIASDGGACVGMAYDASDDASVASLVAATVEQFGRVDFMHANAANMKALLADGDVTTLSPDTFDATIAVNLRGPYSCARHAMPHLVANRGAFIVTSSAAAYVGEPERVAYAMTKAGVGALVRHIASRWGKDGVRANAIAPGLVLTEHYESTMPPERREKILGITRSSRLGRVEDIAAMVAMLFSAEGEWINGQVIAVDGGASIRP